MEAEKDMSHPKINKVKMEANNALSGICLVRMFGFNLIDKYILYFYFSKVILDTNKLNS